MASESNKLLNPPGEASPTLGGSYRAFPRSIKANVQFVVHDRDRQGQRYVI
jgi:hypothetical protein